MKNTLEVIILAAGKGTRMKSALPKVLHHIAGKPMLHHVVDTALQLKPEAIHVVVGHGAEQVKESFKATSDADSLEDEITRANCKLHFAEQTEQLGTGHAVMQASSNLKQDSKVLILYGDVPLLRKKTLQKVVDSVEESFTLLTQILTDPTGYGRIKRDDSENILSIVEQKDASTSELAIQEINTGVMALPSDKLNEWLPKLSDDNAQNEYYLTDLIALAARSDTPIQAINPSEQFEPQGVNNRVQQAELERAYQLNCAKELMMQGLYLSDPARVDVRGKVTFGSDCKVDVNCIFIGHVELGDNVQIGPSCILENCKIGSGSKIAAFSSIDDSELGENVAVGPYARLRPGTRLANKTKIGNFVETKKAVIGEGSKVNHLSYIGDTKMGTGVNVGAGTITCNYDGVNKHLTHIEDDVFVGSNSSIVAPVTLSQGSTIGAGSTITRTTPEHTLTLTRAKQLSLPEWKRPKKK